MENPDFYTDKKYCAHCDDYVNYLMAMDHSFCVNCGERVRLFSKKDWESFNESLSRGRSKGGRPRKNRQEKSA